MGKYINPKVVTLFMVKRLNGKGVNFKKTSAGLALTAFLLSPQVAYASNSPKNSDEKAPLSIILGARRGIGGNGSSGVEFGIKHKGFAGVGYIGSRSDRKLQDTEEEMIRGIYSQSREDLENFSSFGASLEYHQPFAKWVSGVIGIGGNLESYTRKIEENLFMEKHL